MGKRDALEYLYGFVGTPVAAWLATLLWEDLDRASTDHPVVARRIDCHLGSLNSKALELASDLAGTRGFEVDASLAGPVGRVCVAEGSECLMSLNADGDVCRVQRVPSALQRREHVRIALAVRALQVRAEVLIERRRRDGIEQ